MTTPGIVLSQNPVGGTVVPVGSAVDLVVSAASGVGHVNLNPNITFQTMKGWEGVAQIGHTITNSQNWTPEVLDRLVNELGINRVRLETANGGSSPFRRSVEPVNDNNDPNNINFAAFHFDGLDPGNGPDTDIDGVVMPMRQLLAANGESLYVNFCTVRVGNRATDAFHINPAEFAEYIEAHFIHFDQKYGFVPDGVEVTLEPEEFETFDQNASSIGAALVAAGDRLASHGWFPDFAACSNSNVPNAISYSRTMANVPRIFDYWTDNNYHRYGTISTSLVNTFSQESQDRGLRSAMSEHINSGIDDLWEDLTIGNNSWWEQFALAFPGDDTGLGSKYYTILNAQTNPQVVMTNRTPFLRQIFRFVRMGAVRIQATIAPGAPGAIRRVLGWVNTDGRFVLVANPSGAVTFTVGGLPPGTYGINYSTGSAFNVSQPNQIIGAGGLVTASIPASGVITVFEI